MGRKKMSVCLFLAVMFGFMLAGVFIQGITAYADTAGNFTVTGGVQGTDYTYDAASGELKIISDKAMTISGTAAAPEHICIKGGVNANLTFSGLVLKRTNESDIGPAVAIEDDSTGNVTITISGTNELTGNVAPAIQKSGAYSEQLGTLTFKGDGKLTARSRGDETGKCPAVIGGAIDKEGSKIVFESGNITAISQRGGAAIGGGHGQDGTYITIKGGTIEARRNDNNTSYPYKAYGAAIGGGGGQGTNGIGGAGRNITISGGTVKALCNASGGAAIGGGKNGDAENIRISGGTVTAEGGGTSAGIGSSGSGNATGIYISGGDITAKSYSNGAGIGTGSDTAAKSVVDVTITGGTVNASAGGQGPGIGLSARGIAYIYISGGSINAKGGSTSASDGSNLHYADPIGIGAEAKRMNAKGTAEAELPGGYRAFVTYSREDDTAIDLETNPVTVTYSGMKNQIVVPTLIYTETKEKYTGYGTKDLKTDSSGNLYLYLVDGVSVLSTDDCICDFKITLKKDGVLWNGQTVSIKNSAGNTYTAEKSGDSLIFSGVFKMGTYKVYVNDVDTGKEISLNGADIDDQTLEFYSVTKAADIANAAVELPKFAGSEMALAGTDYTFSVVPDQGYNVEVSYQISGGPVEMLSGNQNTYTIPAQKMTGSVKIFVETQKIIVDNTPPTGRIVIDGTTNSSKVNTDSKEYAYHLHSNRVTVCAADAETGIASMEYAVSSAIYTTADAIKKASLTWTKEEPVKNDNGEYEISFAIKDNVKQIVYVRLTDKASVPNVAYLSSIVLYNDTTAPVLSGISLNGTNLSVTFTLSDTKATSCNYAYVVLPASQSAPRTMIEIKEQITAANGAAKSGNGKITGSVSGLLPGKTYKLYIAADDGMKDLSGTAYVNSTEVAEYSVTLPKAALTLAVSPTFTGEYGTAIKDMVCSENGRVTYGGQTVAGSWKLEDNSKKTQRPSVGSYKDYTAVFTPEDTESYLSLSGQAVSVVVSARDIGKTDIQVDTPQMYTGKEQTPTVTVNDTGAVITENDYTVSYSNNKAVGTATVTIKGKNNYQGTKSANFEIQKLKGQTTDKVLAVTDEDINHLVSFEMSQIVANTVDKNLMQNAVYKAEGGDSDSVEYAVKGSVLEITVKDGIKNTEKQDIKITVTCDNYTDMEATLSLSYTTKTKLFLTGIEEPQNTVYNGESVGISLDGAKWETAGGEDKNSEVKELIEVLYKGVNGTEYNSTEAPINAGDYEVHISLKENSNYVEGISWSRNYRISPKEIDVSAAVWQEETEFTYNQEKHQIELAFYPDGVTPSYKGNEATDAGYYIAEVSFTVEDTRNYKIVNYAKKCNWTIHKADYDMRNVAWNYQLPFMYEENKTYQVAVTNCPDGVIPIYSGITQAVQAGKYTAYVTFDVKDSNYNIPAALNPCEWEILSEELKDYDMSQVRWNYDPATPFTYDGSTVYRVELTSLPEGLTVTYENNEAMEAGIYTATAYFASNNPNYQVPEPMTLDWAIVDGTQTNEYDMSQVTWNYNQETPFIYDGITVYRVELISLPEGLTATYEGNEAMEAGIYTAIAYFESSDPNYQVPEPMILEWAIINGTQIPGEVVPNPLPAGTVQPIDGVNYMVTAAEAMTVEYMGPIDKNIVSAVIPAEVILMTGDTQTVYRVEKISSGAFSGCGKLKTVTIASGITEIGANAFKNCKALTKITIPNSVTNIGANAFNGCKKLTTVKMGSGLTSIANGTFSGCSKLKTVTIGSNVKTIGNKAFYKCTSLKKITIPKKVTQIGSQAFFGCKNLKTITIKSKVLKKVGSKAIKGIHKKANIKCPTKKLAANYKKKLFKSKTGYVKTMKIK